MIDDVRAKIEAAVPRLRIEFVQILSDVINDLAGAARPVEIKLFGADLERARGVRASSSSRRCRRSTASRTSSTA